MRIAKATVAALGDCRTLAHFGEIGDQRLAVFFVDLGADRHFENDILAVGAGAVLAHPIPAALRLEMLLVAVIDQSIETIDGLDQRASPPFPPSPPFGPPNSMNFSRRNETQPFPPAPDAMYTLASSRNFMALGYIASRRPWPKRLGNKS